MKTEQFWEDFLQLKGLPENTPLYDTFHFDMNEQSANELLALVLAGQKRATASSVAAFGAQGMRLPQAGDYSIVTDWAGTPRCVIQTTAVTILPFCEMTFEICSREGEDDTLESWQRGHRRFFQQEGAELGYEFTEDMPVVFEDFAVVHQN